MKKCSKANKASIFIIVLLVFVIGCGGSEGTGVGKSTETTYATISGDIEISLGDANALSNSEASVPAIKRSLYKKSNDGDTIAVYFIGVDGDLEEQTGTSCEISEENGSISYTCNNVPTGKNYIVKFVRNVNDKTLEMKANANLSQVSESSSEVKITVDPESSVVVAALVKAVLTATENTNISDEIVNNIINSVIVAVNSLVEDGSITIPSMVVNEGEENQDLKDAAKDIVENDTVNNEIENLVYIGVWEETSSLYTVPGHPNYVIIEPLGKLTYYYYQKDDYIKEDYEISRPYTIGILLKDKEGGGKTLSGWDGEHEFNTKDKNVLEEISSKNGTYTYKRIEKLPEDITTIENGFNDLDGDGVQVYKDKCPGTPAGSTVDEYGCFKDKPVLPEDLIGLWRLSSTSNSNLQGEKNYIRFRKEGDKIIQDVYLYGYMDAGNCYEDFVNDVKLVQTPSGTYDVYQIYYDGFYLLAEYTISYIDDNTIDITVIDKNGDMDDVYWGKATLTKASDLTVQDLQPICNASSENFPITGIWEETSSLYTVPGHPNYVIIEPLGKVTYYYQKDNNTADYEIGRPYTVGILLDINNNLSGWDGTSAFTLQSSDVLVEDSSKNGKYTYKRIEKLPEDITTIESGFNDLDGDGVQAYKDKCPGTPAGSTVDEDGCSKDKPVLPEDLIGLWKLSSTSNSNLQGEKKTDYIGFRGGLR